jgi:hypothetical protein
MKRIKSVVVLGYNVNLLMYFEADVFAMMDISYIVRSARLDFLGPCVSGTIAVWEWNLATYPRKRLNFHVNINYTYRLPRQMSAFRALRPSAQIVSTFKKMVAEGHPTSPVLSLFHPWPLSWMCRRRLELFSLVASSLQCMSYFLPIIINCTNRQLILQAVRSRSCPSRHILQTLSQ